MRDPMGVVPEPALAVLPALVHDAEVFFSEFAEQQVAVLFIAHVWRRCCASLTESASGAG